MAAGLALVVAALRFGFSAAASPSAGSAAFFVRVAAVFVVFGAAFAFFTGSLPALASTSVAASSAVSAAGSLPFGSVALTLPQLT